MKPRSSEPVALRQELSVARIVPPPRSPRRLLIGIVSMFVLLPLLLLLIPWVQTIPGTGQVIAYGPVERRQTIDSPVKGRVSKWLVTEGTYVEEGTPLVEVLGNDPELSRRLEGQAKAQADKVEAMSQNLEAFNIQVEALRIGRGAALDAAAAKVAQAEQKQEAASRKLSASTTESRLAQVQRDRVLALQEEGISSARDLDLAELSAQKAEAQRASDAAALEAARQAVAQSKSELASKTAEIDAKIADAVSKREKVRGELEDARSKLLEAESKTAAQADRVIRAPRAGTIFRLLSLEGQAQVKIGSPLAELIPSTEQRAVELFVDGNDAAWVDPGRNVRIQFEGWPAVQFGGWPGAAMGTFGGKVAFIDASDDGKGNFRVVIRPDAEDAPWPRTTELRQGVRAKGWILLDTVTLAYELWRQINGFPPETARSKAPAPKVKGLK